MLFSQAFWLGFWAKPFQCRFSFGGAISTLAREKGGSIQDLHWSFIWVCFQFWVVVICLERLWHLEGLISSIEEVMAWFQVCIHSPFIIKYSMILFYSKCIYYAYNMFDKTIEWERLLVLRKLYEYFRSLNLLLCWYIKEGFS